MFETTWGWVNAKRILILVQTIPLVNLSLDVLGQQQSDNPETNLFSIEFNLQCSIETQAPINMFSSHSSSAELHVKEQER